MGNGMLQGLSTSLWGLKVVGFIPGWPAIHTWGPKVEGVILKVAGVVLQWMSTSMWDPVVAVHDEWGLPRDLENNGPSWLCYCIKVSLL